MNMGCGLRVWFSIGCLLSPSIGWASVVFSCDSKLIPQIEKEMTAYFAELDFPATEVALIQMNSKEVRYELNTPASDTDTLSLVGNRKLDINPEILSYKRFDGKTFSDGFTSRKEILAALMQHGREYRLKGVRCSVSSLKEHVGVRQGIAKWNKLADR